MINGLLDSLRAAKLCRRAYSGRAREPFQSFVNRNARGMISCTASRTTIVVAGSDDFRDWAHNLDYRGSNVYGEDYHKGFLMHSALVRSALLSMERYLPRNWRDKPVYLYGHSLGGAVAKMLPMMMDLNVREIVTFGAPQCSSEVYPQAHNLLEYRVAGDPVPHLPLSWEDGGAVRRLGKTRISLGLEPTWQSMLRRAAYLYWGSKCQLLRKVSKKHSIDRYIEGLERFAFLR